MLHLSLICISDVFTKQTKCYIVFDDTYHPFVNVHAYNYIVHTTYSNQTYHVSYYKRDMYCITVCVVHNVVLHYCNGQGLVKKNVTF